MSLEGAIYLLGRPSLGEMASELEESFLHTMLHYADEPGEAVMEVASALATAYELMRAAADAEADNLELISNDIAESVFRDAWVEAYAAATKTSPEAAADSFVGFDHFDWSLKWPRLLLAEAGRVVGRVEAMRTKSAMEAETPRP